MYIVFFWKTQLNPGQIDIFKLNRNKIEKLELKKKPKPNETKKKGMARHFKPESYHWQEACLDGLVNQ